MTIMINIICWRVRISYRCMWRVSDD